MYNITPEKLFEDSVNLAKKLKVRNYDAIIAVSRGGLIPATYIAHELGIKEVYTLGLSSYDDESIKQKNMIVYSRAELDKNMKVLIVDDLVDTGTSLNLIRKLYPKLDIACVYSKCHKCDVFFQEFVDPEQWIRFYYEK